MNQKNRATTKVHSIRDDQEDVRPTAASLINDKHHGPTLEAGRALDALVAEKVFGRVVEWIGGDPFYRFITDGWTGSHRILTYSTNIENAWEVVASRGLGEWSWRLDQTDAGNWFAEIKLGYNSSYSKAFPVWADTAPLAICLAALKAVQ